MKKIVMVYMSMIGLLILAGVILNNSLGSDTLRSLHKILGLASAIVGVIAVITAFKSKSRLLVKLLLITSVAAILLAGTSGKSAVSGKGGYSVTFNAMRMLGVVSLLTAAGSYLIISEQHNDNKQNINDQPDN